MNINISTNRSTNYIDSIGSPPPAGRYSGGEQSFSNFLPAEDAYDIDSNLGLNNGIAANSANRSNPYDIGNLANATEPAPSKSSKNSLLAQLEQILEELMRLLKKLINKNDPEEEDQQAGEDSPIGSGGGSSGGGGSGFAPPPMPAAQPMPTNNAPSRTDSPAAVGNAGASGTPTPPPNVAQGGGTSLPAGSGNPQVAGNGSAPVQADPATTVQPSNGAQNVITGTPGTTPAGRTELGGGADPSIVHFNGEYWLAQSTAGQEITLSHSANLNDLVRDGKRSVINVNEPGFKAEAPSLAVVTDPNDGKQKLAVYATNQRMDGAGRIKALMVNDPADPASSTVDKGYLQNVNGYDSQYFSHPNGKNYMLYSDFKSLKITEMADPWTTKGEPVTISSADSAWENKESSLNEAPAVVISGNKLNIVYSSNNWNSGNYANGLLTTSLNADPLDPSQYSKQANPIFGSGNGLVGPGSGTFFNDESGNTMWAFGSLTAEGSGQRNISVQKAGFTEDGTVQI